MSAKKIFEDEEVYPEFGEGSEYGRKRREEVRFSILDQVCVCIVGMGISEYRIQKNLNPKLSGIVFCSINQVIGFDFIEKSIILLQTVIVCHACMNYTPNVFYLCVHV